MGWDVGLTGIEEREGQERVTHRKRESARERGRQSEGGKEGRRERRERGKEKSSIRRKCP